MYKHTAKQEIVVSGFAQCKRNKKERNRPCNTSFPPFQIFSCLQEHLNVACIYLHFNTQYCSKSANRKRHYDLSEEISSAAQARHVICVSVITPSTYKSGRSQNNTCF